MSGVLKEYYPRSSCVYVIIKPNTKAVLSVCTKVLLIITAINIKLIGKVEYRLSE